MQNNKVPQTFLLPPSPPPPTFRPQKISGPPLFAMKIMGQPKRKACKLNFYWKICSNLFHGPLPRVKNFKTLTFYIRFPSRSVCEWSCRNSLPYANIPDYDAGSGLRSQQFATHSNTP